jgi:hypothetical protein
MTYLYEIKNIKTKETSCIEVFAPLEIGVTIGRGVNPDGTEAEWEVISRI